MSLGQLADLATRLGGTVVGDPACSVESFTSIEDVVAGALTFATDDRYLRAALASGAVAVLTETRLVDSGRTYPKPLLVVASVRTAMADLLALLEAPPPPPGVHPSASIDPSATLGAHVSIGPLVSIGPRATIGAHCIIEAGAVVGTETVIGESSRLYPRSSVLDRCRLGRRVIVKSGATIGNEGFGWAFVEGALRKIPQVGTVELGDDVEIGANTCVDRAQTGVTSIGDGTKIDNLCQIGHNCRIGKHTVIAGQSGLAGSTIIGSYVQVGGQVAFRGHVTVGDRCVIAGGTHIWNDIEPGQTVSGRPARPHREELRGQALLRKLPKLFERVDTLERVAIPHAE